MNILYSKVIVIFILLLIIFYIIISLLKYKKNELFSTTTTTTTTTTTNTPQYNTLSINLLGENSDLLEIITKNTEKKQIENKIYSGEITLEQARKQYKEHLDKLKRGEYNYFYDETEELVKTTTSPSITQNPNTQNPTTTKNSHIKLNFI